MGAYNSKYFLQNEQGKPAFIFLWANWCHFCKEFKPDWEELSNLTEYENKLYFVQVECEENRAFCKKFEGENFPRLYWWDTKTQTAIRYLGERSVAHCKEFINKQFQFPLIPVDLSELEHYKSTSNIAATFNFEIRDDDPQLLEVARGVATQLRHLEVRFLISNTTGKSRFTQLLSNKEGDTYIGNWTIEDLSNFVLLRSIPYQSELTGYVLKHLENKSLPTLVVVSNQVENNLTNLTDNLRSDALITTINCSNIRLQWFCKYTALIKKPGNHLVYLDWKKRLFWIYKGNLSSTTVSEWISRIKTKKVIGEGPGTGVLSHILRIKYDGRVQGYSSYIMYIPVFVVLTAFGILTQRMNQAQELIWEEGRRKEAKEKKN